MAPTMHEDLPGATLAPSPYDDGEMYDVVFRDFDMDREFFVQLAREAKGPVLEVACGTGRLLIPCLEAGADVDGIDLHPAMLQTLRRKAKALGLEPRVTEADMRDFTQPRRYELVTIPFNAFLHNLTIEDQLSTLTCCREHLEPGGRLVLHISFFGAATIATSGAGPVLEMETVHPVSGHTLRLYDGRTMNPVEQLQHSINEIHEIDAKGNTLAVHRTETWVRWIHKPELELLLRQSGFLRYEILGGFDGRKLESEEDQMVVFAWKD